ncbi:hypothetical protein J2TS6_58210 [Paenibacillus albilobatus]|uniref:Uncharacterized protein n=2 Tax=Paenibacillus TaxID=44249 RepID=A0A919XPS0_9BACL|nr:hypothetical protein [Paenibacillus albilobatus]GIO34680.1 hypothetical protein J2TS6_58210 [Paenibacillus albilobatus]
MNGPLYEGKPLTIGVIGEPPEVRETNISFVALGLEELAKNPEKLSSRFDAVFITKDYFREASEPEYKKAFKEANIPYIFIKLDKLIVAYTVEELTYDDVPDAFNHQFAFGIDHPPGGEETHWGFGLYNDTENEANVKTTYSTIFRTIESKSINE